MVFIAWPAMNFISGNLHDWLGILSLETTGVVRGSYFYKARTIFLPPLGFHLHMEMYILQFSD